MLELASINAQTLLQLKIIQGQTMGSLSETAALLSSQYGLTVPSFSVGTDRVPADMLAMVHKGEQIVPAAYNPNNNQQQNKPLDREVVTAIVSLEKRLAAIEANTGTTTKILKDVTEGGRAMQTEAYT